MSGAVELDLKPRTMTIFNQEKWPQYRISHLNAIRRTGFLQFFRLPKLLQRDGYKQDPYERFDTVQFI